MGAIDMLRSKKLVVRIRFVFYIDLLSFNGRYRSAWRPIEKYVKYVESA